MNINWLKLDINILNDSKIKLIRKYPDGNALIVLWIGLLCLAMKSDTGGYVYITQGIPYSAKDLSNEFDIEEKTVEMGLQLFKKFGMIDSTEAGYIEVINFNKHQNLDKIEMVREQNRKRQIEHRAKSRNVTSRVSNGEITQQIRLDLDKIRLDTDKTNKETPEKSAIDLYLETVPLQLFNAITDFVQHRKEIKKPMSLQAIKKAVSQLDKLYPNDFIKQAECIDASIVGGWQGIFPLKEQGTKSKSFSTGFNPEDEGQKDAWGRICKNVEEHKKAVGK